MSGWIKVHRSILNHWLYTEKRKFSKLEAWHDLLLNVNYSDTKTIIKGKLYEVKRGESILSLDSWSKRWNWDKSSVRRFFNLLEKETMIIVKSDNITTHLTICKYESYQGERNADETQTNRKRIAKEIQKTPIEEYKESKEEKEKKNIPDFDIFLNYALTKEPNIDEVELKKKYDAWFNNNWHDGNGKKIIIWKTKLNSTIPYIKTKQSKQQVEKEFFKITL